jgi:ornithine cyclodeaminase/alanine dehydrogenase-like protein (mu-crystallin family)
MVMILNESDVNGLINMNSVISAVEGALKQYSEKNAIMPTRYQMEVPGTPGTIRVMLAALPESKAAGLKVLTGTAGKRMENGSYFVVMLFDPDGSLRCILSGNRLTQLRTGAASAVATKHLARKEAKIIGLIGGGVQGLGQLEGVCNVLKGQEWLIFDVIPQNAERTAKLALERFGLKLEIAKSADEVAARSDVLITATTSRYNIFNTDVIKRGTHINAIGSNLPSRRELDEKILNRSKVVVDSIEQSTKESGDLLEPISTGAYSPQKIYAELGEIIAGKKRGRENDEEVTIFKSVGLAVEDLAAASLAYSLAVKRNRGTEVTL